MSVDSVSLRCKLAVAVGKSVGGVSWECELAVSVGGVDWQCQLASQLAVLVDGVS